MPKNIVKLLTLEFLIFLFTLLYIEHTHCMSCIGSSSEDLRLCEPNARDKEGECRCHGIVVDNRGDADCHSRYANVPFCYVVDELSGCSDKTPLDSSANFTHLWNRTISFSDIACEGENIQKAEIGNEDVLPGIELSNNVADFYKKFPSNSSTECQAECKNRFFCRAWTFIKGDPGVCRLVGANACCDQFQTRMKNPEATSGYNCVKDYPDFKGCWSTEGACPKCPQVQELSSGIWEKCMQNGTLLWAPSQQCYPPLDQGPCQENEWLVLRDDLPSPTLESVCRKKRCFSEEKKISDICEEISDVPECSDEEFTIFNNFGQAVCHCAGGMFPLEDPFSEKSIQAQRKCYLEGDKGPCPENHTLVLNDNNSSGFLKCDDGIVPLTIATAIRGRKCENPLLIFVFGKCQSGRRSG